MQRARERSIDMALFQSVVLQPDSKSQQYRGAHGGFVYLFKKKIGSKELSIAAEIYKDECFFVTGFWT